MQELQGVCGYVSRFNPCVYRIPASSEIIICSQGRLIRQRQQFPGYICILETERIGVFSAKNRDMDIHIVVNADLALALAAAVEPSSVLRQCAASGDDLRRLAEALLEEVGDGRDAERRAHG